MILWSLSLWNSEAACAALPSAFVAVAISTAAIPSVVVPAEAPTSGAPAVAVALEGDGDNAALSGLAPPAQPQSAAKRATETRELIFFAFISGRANKPTGLPRKGRPVEVLSPGSVAAGSAAVLGRSAGTAGSSRVGGVAGARVCVARDVSHAIRGAGLDGARLVVLGV